MRCLTRCPENCAFGNGADYGDQRTVDRRTGGEGMKRKSVVIVAGEASGDLHGSHLIHALRKQYDAIDICGMGGRAMQEAGAEILVDSDKLAVVGITEVLAKVSEVLKAMSLLKRTLAEARPDLLILIDYPEFNLHLAATGKKLGIPILYYISPQLWAWRSGRVKKIKKRGEPGKLAG